MSATQSPPANVPTEMSRVDRISNLLAVIVPFVAVLVAIVLLWNKAVNAADLGIMVVMYVLTGVGITVGFHSLLTHRSFATYPWIERTFAVLGSLAVEGSVLDWVADHRKHHAFSDKDGDPHSPHVGHGDRPARPLARTRGLADGDPGPVRLEALRARPLRGPGDAEDRQAVPAARARHAAAADAGRLRAQRLHARRRARGLPVGRPGPDLLGPPRDLVDQLPLPRYGASASRSTISPRTSRGWRCRRSASPGTTTTMPSRGPPSTD